MADIYEYFEVIEDYSGVKDDANLHSLKRGDVVRLIQKDNKYFTVEKDEHFRKVPKEILVQKNKVSSSVKSSLKVHLSYKTSDSDTHFKSSLITNKNNKFNPFTNVKSSYLFVQQNKYKLQIQPSKYSNNQISLFTSINLNDQILQHSQSEIQSEINIKQKLDMKYSKQNSNNQIETHHVFHLKGKMKKVQQIIEDYSLTEEQKENKIKQTFKKLKQKDFNYLKEKSKMNKIKIKIRELEKELIRSTQTICVIGQFVDIKDETPIQITNILKQRFSQLIHINCPKELNCPLCVTIPNSIKIQELKTVIFDSFVKVLLHNIDLRHCLINTHNFLKHITLTIISFTNSYQLRKKIKQQMQLSELQYSHQFISSCIGFIYKLSYSTNFKSIKYISNPLSSIIKLSNYNIFTYSNKEENLQSFDIRNKSRECLGRIQHYGNKSLHKQLSTFDYFSSLIISISSAGGFGEEDDQEIIDTLYYINRFLNYLFNGKQEIGGIYSHAFSPQPKLVKLSTEQIEASLINQRSKVDFFDYAKQTKRIIFNIFIKKHKSWSF